MADRRFLLLARATTAVALGVIILGAYVRLSDAGLGCPDWPGCYGQLLGVPETAAEIERAQENYPNNRIDAAKAWKELMHRYLAGVLGLMIFALAGLALFNRRDPAQPTATPLFLAVLVVFQAILGAWTVTMLLKPIVVTAHLLGGFATLALLWHLAAPRWRVNAFASPPPWRYAALACIIVLVAQIALGGWVAGNYAALACTDFPTCQGQWWPPMNFTAAFSIGAPGVNYEYGVLDNTARTAIHVTHRIGALVTALLLGGFLIALLTRRPPRTLAYAAGVALTLLALQALLGVGNVVWQLPLPVAVAHNAAAAMLLLALLTVARMLKSRPTHVRP